MKLTVLYESRDLNRMVEIAASLLRTGTPFSTAVTKSISQLGITDRNDIRRLFKQVGDELRRRSAVKRRVVKQNIIITPKPIKPEMKTDQEGQGLLF